jgi:hypothetical protein
MDLVVSTLTRGDRPRWLAQCCASVASELPRGAQHVVSRCPSDFQGARWESAQWAEAIAFVDDDDMMVGNALDLCRKALEQTGAGVAFTFEQRIDANGAPMSCDTRSRTTHDVAMHPRMLHHLAVVRRSCLHPVILEHAQRIGIGIDWLIRAYAALKHGAVQVPVIGYLWRQHDQATSASAGWSAAYEAAMPELRAVTRSWERVCTPIPRWMPA